MFRVPLDIINRLLDRHHALYVSRVSIRIRQARHNVQNVPPVLTEHQHEPSARFVPRVRCQLLSVLKMLVIVQCVPLAFCLLPIARHVMNVHLVLMRLPKQGLAYYALQVLIQLLLEQRASMLVFHVLRGRIQIYSVLRRWVFVLLHQLERGRVHEVVHLHLVKQVLFLQQ